MPLLRRESRSASRTAPHTPARDRPRNKPRNEPRVGARAGRLVAAGAAAAVALTALSGCGGRSEIEQTYDKYATAWGMSTEATLGHTEKGIMAGAEANCDLRGRYPITPASMDPDEGFIINMSAMVMAVCPSEGPEYISAFLEEGPSSGPLHDKLARMLADVTG